jgi:PAS domain S-box-containing protein
VAALETSVREFGIVADALTAAERALSERSNELQAVLDTVPVAVWFTYDPRGREVIRNHFAAELMGLAGDATRRFGAPDLVIDTQAFHDGREVSREDRPLTRAMRGEQTDNQEFAYVLPGGLTRTLLTSARPIRDGAGAILGAVQVSLDISDRQRAEEHRRLLVRELNHRVKNTLAVVQSIANQTLRGASDLREANSALASRLSSLARAHDILTHENWSGADLDEVVGASIRPHEELARFEIAGAPVRLRPSLALSMSMAFLDGKGRRGPAAPARQVEGTRRPAYSADGSKGLRNAHAQADPVRRAGRLRRDQVRRGRAGVHFQGGVAAARRGR